MIFFLNFFLYDVQVVARLLENVVAGRYSNKKTTTMYVRSCDCHMMHQALQIQVVHISQWISSHSKKLNGIEFKNYIRC